MIPPEFCECAWGKTCECLIPIESAPTILSHPVCDERKSRLESMDLRNCPRVNKMLSKERSDTLKTAANDWKQFADETKAGLETVLTAITSLNRGDRCTSSMECGPVGSRVKFYFDPNDPKEAEMLMRNALTIRAMTLRELAKQEERA